MGCTTSAPRQFDDGVFQNVLAPTMRTTARRRGTSQAPTPSIIRTCVRVCTLLTRTSPNTSTRTRPPLPLLWTTHAPRHPQSRCNCRISSITNTDLTAPKATTPLALVACASPTPPPSRRRRIQARRRIRLRLRSRHRLRGHRLRPRQTTTRPTSPASSAALPTSCMAAKSKGAAPSTTTACSPSITTPPRASTSTNPKCPRTPPLNSTPKLPPPPRSRLPYNSLRFRSLQFFHSTFSLASTRQCSRPFSCLLASITSHRLPFTSYSLLSFQNLVAPRVSPIWPQKGPHIDHPLASAWFARKRGSFATGVIRWRLLRMSLEGT